MRNNRLKPKPLERSNPTVNKERTRKNKSTLHELDYEELDRFDDLLEAEETLWVLKKAKDPEPVAIKDAQLLVEECRDTLASAADLMGNKLENYAKYIQNLTNLKKGIEFQITAFQKRKSGITSTLDWLKDTLLAFLNNRGIKSIPAGALRIAKQKSAPTVLIEIPVEALPRAFQRITIEAEKNDLRDAIAAGDKIDGVSIIQKEHIRIRTQ